MSQTRGAAGTALTRRGTSLSCGSELAGLLTFDLRGSESGYHAAAMLGRPPFSPHDSRDLGCLLLPPGQRRPAVEVTVAAAMRIMRADDPADIAVTLAVHQLFENGSRHEVNEIRLEPMTAYR